MPNLSRRSGRREDALIARPEADVSVHVLPPDGYAFAARLSDGATFAEAAEALSNPDEFGTHVVGLVGAGAVASITFANREPRSEPP